MAAWALALGGILATVGPALAAFQVVRMSVTSGSPGQTVTIRIEASLLIGGSEQSQLFLVPQNAYEARSEPARCDAIPGATVVGELLWAGAPVKFQGNTYPGFVGTGSFTVPTLATGIYIVAGILDNTYTGCHAFASFGLGMDLPDTASATAGSRDLATFAGIAILIAAIVGVQRMRRTVPSTL